jgi:uncharacterized protein YecT (DUF1311 family)
MSRAAGWIALLLLVGACATRAEVLCAHAGSSGEKERCLIVELATAESQLARYLEESRRSLDGAGKAALDEAQRSFVSYRSAQCRALSDLREAAQRSSEKLACACELTHRRTRELWVTYHKDMRGGLPEPTDKSATDSPAR